MNHYGKAVTAFLFTLLAACGGDDDNPVAPAYTTGPSASGTSDASPNADAGTNTGAGSTPTGTADIIPGAPAGASGSGASTGVANTAPYQPAPAAGAGTESNSGAAANTGGASNGGGYVYDETARFHGPTDIETDAAGNLFVIDGNSTLRRIAADGQVSTLPYTFDRPSAIEFDAAGNLYVLAYATIYRIAPDGTRTTLTSLPDMSTVPFTAGESWMTIDAQGNLYTLNTGRYQHIYRVDQNGAFSQILAGDWFRRFYGIASDPSGNVHIGFEAPTGARSIRKVDQSGATSILSPLAFDLMGNMEFDAAGNLYVLSFTSASYSGVPNCGMCRAVTNIRIDRIAPEGSVSTAFDGLPGDGPSNAQATFAGAPHVAAGRNGDLYVTHQREHAIYRIAPDGTANLVAGKPGESGSSD
jgi:hypothetical protein